MSLADFKAEQDRINGEIASAEQTIARLTVTLGSIERSLDQALSLLPDPYKLFTEAPDTVRLMLVQAVFEKLWVMDHDVVGSELTETYQELLTMDAKLTLTAQERTAETATDALSLAAAPPRTYYRQRVSLSDDTSDEDGGLSGLAGRLWVERPRGALPLDSQNPAPPAVEPGSDVHHLVGVAGFEPTAPRSQSECATKLRHTPLHLAVRSMSVLDACVGAHPRRLDGMATTTR